jgi:hypothetical protein
MTAETFYINIMLTQSMDNMGVFTDIDFISANTNTNNNIYNLTETEIATLRIPNKDVTSYYKYPASNSLNFRISGYTDSKIEDLRSYNSSNPFQVGFDMERADYYNYVNQLVKGVSRIHSIGEPKIYVFDTPSDANLGQPSQVNGIKYIEYSGETIQRLNNINTSIKLTQFSYVCEGINMTNSSLSAIRKEEYLFGVIFPPEVKSEVFIERGITSVMDKHLRLSEVKDLSQLARYGNGFYKLNKQ